MSAAATLSDTVELKDQLLKATSESDNDRIVDLLKALAGSFIVVVIVGYHWGWVGWLVWLVSKRASE